MPRYIMFHGIEVGMNIKKREAKKQVGKQVPESPAASTDFMSTISKIDANDIKC